MPFYNEEEIILASLEALLDKLKSLESIIDSASFIVFIDDGSSDTGAIVLKNAIKTLKNITLISLSKNVGHQNALLCGYEYVKDKCDCAISIDCDLQQDIDKMQDFLEAFLGGSEIVFGVREDRKSDGVFKKGSAVAFYKLMSLFGAKIIKNHADYRLVSNKALHLITQYSEVNLFLRGIFLELGLQSSVVYFSVKKREAGKSKYSLKKMLSLALNGITSFSTVPLRLISFGGIIISILSGILGAYGIFIAIFTDSAIVGWASVVVPIYFLGGIQMLSLGIIGEYIGKIYSESKRRPRYIIKDIMNEKWRKKLGDYYAITICEGQYQKRFSSYYFYEALQKAEAIYPFTVFANTR